MCIYVSLSLYIYEYICISHTLHIYISQIHIYFNLMLTSSLFQLSRTTIHPAASICQVGYQALQGTERKIEQGFYFQKVYILVHCIFPSKGKPLNFISKQFLGACAISRNSEQQQEEDSRISIHPGQISHGSQLNEAWVAFRNCTTEWALPKFEIPEEMPTCYLQLQQKYCVGYCMV